MEKTIRQFKGIALEEKKTLNTEHVNVHLDLLKETLTNGFLLSPEILASNIDKRALANIVKQELGLTPQEMNNSLHKSWNKVATASEEQLVVEQMIHYITTYGYQRLGIYDDNTVYIPHEELNIPGLNKNIKLTIIKTYTKEELKAKALNLLSVGIALKEETMNDMVGILGTTGFEDKDIESIKNKEARTIFYDLTGEIPKSPTELVRLLIYQTTGKTLLIKSPGVLNTIKEADNNKTSLVLSRYKTKYGLQKLAESFHRYKPIYLALKNDNTKSYINKIRKLAKRHHKPMKEDYLNELTANLSKGKDISVIELKTALSEANVFRKIRLAYALNYRTKDVDSIMYRVRNGKSWTKEFTSNIKPGAKIALDIVMESITESLKSNVEGKTIFIPSNIHYSLPATEKQFTGNFPSGTYVDVSHDMIVGINWKNVGSKTVDLDLKMVGLGSSVGWDSMYRTEKRDILFSGDITSAPGPDGATELFYVRQQPKEPFLLMLNYFNYLEDIDVPFKILVAQEETTNFEGNYMVDPNNVVSITTDEMTEIQAVIGMVVPSNNGIKFIYCKSNAGGGRSSSVNELSKNINNYLYNFYDNALELDDVLTAAGAVIVRKNTDDTTVDIDLSPEVLEKDTIIKLLTENK